MYNIMNNGENNDTGKMGLVIPPDLLVVHSEERKPHNEDTL